MAKPSVAIDNETERERILPNVTFDFDQTKLRVRAILEVSMLAQVVPMTTEGDEGTATECDERQKRLGLIRTDMHMVYDVPLQVLDAVPTEARAHRLQWEAQSILRVQEDPQDRDAVGTEM